MSERKKKKKKKKKKRERERERVNMTSCKMMRFGIIQLVCSGVHRAQL